MTNPRERHRHLRSADPATGANPAHVNPITGKTWGAEDPAGVDTG